MQAPMDLEKGVLDKGAAGYPARLLGLADPPKRLWFSGRVPARGEKSLAIVGSRAASGGGCDFARQVAADMGRRGWSIVSGGAFGIDAAAHEGALAAGAPTFAVLGCGVDVVYPDRHEELFARIAASGGLLTEYPPGTQPRPGQFPKRNRIVVALAGAVLIVEAAPRSGALVSARLAHEYGCPVLARPGTAGTDQWIADGRARTVRSADDIEAVLAGGVVTGATEAASAPVLPAALAQLVAALGKGPGSAEGIARHLALPLGQVLGLLVEAELEGLVRRIAGGYFEVRLGH